MPVQNPPVEPSAFHELKARVDRLEALEKRRGRQLVTVDRIVTANLPAPSEGQIAVEASTDDLAYYANGAWRTIGGAASWGGPTWYRPLYGTEGHDRCEVQNGSLNDWEVFATSGATAKYGSFYISNCDNAGTTWQPAQMYIGMNLGPAGSMWGVQIVYDIRTDGGEVTFKWATDPQTDGVAADPRTLTYYTTGNSVLNMNGSLVEGNELAGHSIFRINGEAGDMLTANSSGADPTYTFASSMNGGPGLWWLNMDVADGASPSGDYAFILRDLVITRYGDGFALN